MLLCTNHFQKFMKHNSFPLKKLRMQRGIYTQLSGSGFVSRTVELICFFLVIIK